MNRIKHIILLTVFVGSFTNAQESIHKNPFWLNFSAGGSTEYLNASISFNKSLEDFSYQVALNGSNKNLIGTSGVTTGNIGFGYAHNKRWLISSFYFGPSVSYGEARSKSYQNVYFWGFGFALNSQAYFMPLHKIFPDVGIGIEFFYNLNAIQTEDVNYRDTYSIRVGVCLTNIHTN